MCFLRIVQQWVEPESKPGIRFGGVVLIRVEGMAILGYGFVAGNDNLGELYPRHNLTMAIERVRQDTNHNIKNAFYYFCNEIEVVNGVNILCAENMYPQFPNSILLIHRK